MGCGASSPSSLPGGDVQQRDGKKKKPLRRTASSSSESTASRTEEGPATNNNNTRHQRRPVPPSLPHIPSLDGAGGRVRRKTSDLSSPDSVTHSSSLTAMAGGSPGVFPSTIGVIGSLPGRTTATSHAELRKGIADAVAEGANYQQQQSTGTTLEFVSPTSPRRTSAAAAARPPSLTLEPSPTAGARTSANRPTGNMLLSSGELSSGGGAGVFPKPPSVPPPTGGTEGNGGGEAPKRIPRSELPPLLPRNDSVELAHEYLHHNEVRSTMWIMSESLSPKSMTPCSSKGAATASWPSSAGGEAITSPTLTLSLGGYPPQGGQEDQSNSYHH